MNTICIWISIYFLFEFIFLIIFLSFSRTYFHKIVQWSYWLSLLALRASASLVHLKRNSMNSIVAIKIISMIEKTLVGSHDCVLQYSYSFLLSSSKIGYIIYLMKNKELYRIEYGYLRTVTHYPLLNNHHTWFWT